MAEDATVLLLARSSVCSRLSCVLTSRLFKVIAENKRRQSGGSHFWARKLLKVCSLAIHRSNNDLFFRLLIFFLRTNNKML